MTSVETQILEAIVEMDRRIQAMKQGGGKPELLPLWRKLDALCAELPRDTHLKLIHFLENKSYERAREWIEENRASAPVESN